LGGVYTELPIYPRRYAPGGMERDKKKQMTKIKQKNERGKRNYMERERMGEKQNYRREKIDVKLLLPRTTFDVVSN